MLYGQQGAGAIYIYYDAACMDRLEYINQADPSGGKYVAYHINTLQGIKLILSIGTENPEPAAQMPVQTLSCSNSAFNEGLLRTVNQGSTQVFMVRAAGNGRFYISRVAMASLLSYQNNELLYQSPRYQFVFPTITGVIGENISLNKSAVNVQFEGLMDRQCTADYIFSISSLSGPSMYANLVIVPEIGVVEERSGPNLSEAMGNVMRLQTVNGRPINDYLQTLCRGERPVPVAPGTPLADEWTARSPDIPVSAETIVPIPQSVNPAAPVPAASNNPCAEASGNGFHIVQRGENLYRLSQQYGVSVTQLREWNGIGADNIIYPCQKLKVAATAMGQAVPAAYSAEHFAAKGAADTPIWRTYSGTHTVQPGETIASIAMKYGYSEYRFRYFNNLRPNEVARVGQVLKTSDCDCPPAATMAPATPAQTPASYDNVLTPRTPIIGNTAGQTAPGAGNIKPLVLGRGDAGMSETEITSSYWKAVMPPSESLQVPSSYSVESERAPGASSQQLSRGLSDRISGNTVESTLPESYENRAARRRTHLVGNDENLFTIARRYNTTTENLRRLNNLNPGEEVLAGQRIYIE